MTELELTEAEYMEELEKYQFRDWRFEPIFIFSNPPNLTGSKKVQGVIYRNFGVRIWYVAEDNRFPGSSRKISLHIRRFFDPATAVKYKKGWAAWVQAWLWGHIRWVLEHEAREQFFYDGELPLDPHAATGGTLLVSKPSADAVTWDEAKPLPSTP